MNDNDRILLEARLPITDWAAAVCLWCSLGWLAACGAATCMCLVMHCACQHSTATILFPLSFRGGKSSFVKRENHLSVIPEAKMEYGKHSVTMDLKPSYSRWKVREGKKGLVGWVGGDKSVYSTKAFTSANKVLALCTLCTMVCIGVYSHGAHCAVKEGV